MADQWFYRMFGQDFGPVAFGELKELAELGSIASDDEVRNAGSSDWVTAGSIGELGLASGGSATLSARAVMTKRRLTYSTYITNLKNQAAY